MKEKYESIKKHIREVEVEYNIKVLLASIVGSRMLNMHSNDSDFDVSFIYSFNKDEYLRINPLKGKDASIRKDFGWLDLKGWELQKARTLAHTSNCTIWETMSSNLVIINSGNFLEDLSRQALPHQSKLKFYYSYSSIIKHNMDISHHPTAKESCRLIVPIMYLDWIKTKESFPPADIGVIFKSFKASNGSSLSDELIKYIKEAIRLRKTGLGHKIHSFDGFTQFCIDKVKDTNRCITSQDPIYHPINNLDTLFRKYIK